MKLVFTIILLITLILIYYKNKNSHIFWDKQPVMRTYKNKNTFIIGNIPNFKINFNGVNIDIHTSYDINNVYQFINENFNNNYNIDYKYFAYNFKKSGSTNIVLTLNNVILGYINSVPQKIKSKPYLLNYNFVDYLCIKKTYRKKNLASIIISCLLSTFKNKNSYFLFKIEKYPLPFLHIVKTNYFYTEINEHNYNIVNNYISDVKQLSVKTMNDLFKDYITYLSQFKFYPIISLNEFLNIYYYSKSQSLLLYQRDSRIIITGKPNMYKIKSCQKKSFDIDFIIGNITKHNNFIVDLKSYMLNMKYEYVTIPNLANNKLIIDLLEMKPGLDLYYYTYNLNQHKFCNKDFCFNIN